MTEEKKMPPLLLREIAHFLHLIIPTIFIFKRLRAQVDEFATVTSFLRDDEKGRLFAVGKRWYYKLNAQRFCPHLGHCEADSITRD